MSLLTLFFNCEIGRKHMTVMCEMNQRKFFNIILVLDFEVFYRDNQASLPISRYLPSLTYYSLNK